MRELHLLPVLFVRDLCRNDIIYYYVLIVRCMEEEEVVVEARFPYEGFSTVLRYISTEDAHCTIFKAVNMKHEETC